MKSRERLETWKGREFHFSSGKMLENWLHLWKII